MSRDARWQKSSPAGAEYDESLFEETIEESFPASDPPSWKPHARVGAPHRGTHRNGQTPQHSEWDASARLRALFVLDRNGVIFWSYRSPIAINPGPKAFSMRSSD